MLWIKVKRYRGGSTSGESEVWINMDNVTKLVPIAGTADAATAIFFKGCSSDLAERVYGTQESILECVKDLMEKQNATGTPE